MLVLSCYAGERPGIRWQSILFVQGSDLSSSSSVVSSVQPALSPSPGGVRRKRITRRVGYARDAADDDNDAALPRSVPATPGVSTTDGVQQKYPQDCHPVTPGTNSMHRGSIVPQDPRSHSMAQSYRLFFKPFVLQTQSKHTACLDIAM